MVHQRGSNLRAILYARLYVAHGLYVGRIACSIADRDAVEDAMVEDSKFTEGFDVVVFNARGGESHDVGVDAVDLRRCDPIIVSGV